MKRIPLFLLLPSVAAALSYEVRFVGLTDMSALKSLLETSELVSMQQRPPASINGLRYRIAADIPPLVRVLHAYAYYEATITSDVVTEENGALRVDLFIHPGPQYQLNSYEVYSGDCTKLAEVSNCCHFTPELLGLKIGDPALSVGIVNAELQLLTELARCGYPLASTTKRRVEVDMANHTVEAATCMQEGPLSRFGPTTYFGIQDINPRFIERKVAWKEGCVYDADLIVETQRRLLKTELFSSVLITHGEELDQEGELPMKMRVTEAKHRQFSLGGYYATVDGPGVVGTWTHRNIRGMGEIVSAKIDFSKRYWAGVLTYKKPDFLSFDQTYRALAELSREKIHAFLAYTYRFANYIDRPIGGKRFVSAGLKIDHINVTESASNGTYFLIGLPIFGKYDASDDPLDPKKGYTIAYSVTPYQSLAHARQRFAKQRLTGTVYFPLTPGAKIVLALRAQVGSIAGARRRNVPLTKLFLGGSEDDLRGYKYKTVSPVIGTKPFGGRSAIFASAELRIRLMQKIGIVPFADFGTVTFSEIPSFDAKWFKSVGLGLRYFAFFGPLRLDIGFPLDRRKHIDSLFQIYASVGQAY
jgi:translocation and assembly module TamA